MREKPEGGKNLDIVLVKIVNKFRPLYGYNSRSFGKALKSIEEQWT